MNSYNEGENSNQIRSKEPIGKIIKSNLELNILIESLNDNFFLLNEKGIIFFFNEELTLMQLGYDSQILQNNSFTSLLYKDDRKKFEKILENRETSHNAINKFELRMQHKDGSLIWYDFKSKTYYDKMGNLRHFIILRNISDKKIAEEEYQSLFENSPNAIILLDFSGNIIDINSTILKIFGNSKQYYIGKPILEFQELYPQELKAYFKKIFKASFIGDFPKPIEAKFSTSNSGTFWAILQASFVRVKNNSIIQILFQDITEKKEKEILEKQFTEKLEIEVKKRTEDLNKALEEQKLYLDQILRSSQIKSEFMATMSHELRTPLNAIIGFTELLLEGVYGKLKEEQIEIINDIKDSAQHEFEMIKKILNISEIEAGQTTLHKKDFSVKNIVDQVISSLKPIYIKKDLKIVIKGLDNDIIMCADPIRFKEIMLNLISNALKFTELGTVTIAVQEKIDRWIFKITDTGIGIAQKDRDIIFKEFKRVESTYVRSVSGTGLGLPLTRKLIHLHGGDINFSSMLGAGTVFTFYIPKTIPEELKDIL